MVKLAAVVSLLLNLGGAQISAVAQSSSANRPIRSIVVFVSDGARDQFLARVGKFAEEQAFTTRVSQTRPDGRHFLVQLWREDVNMTAVNPFTDPTEFRIDLYQTGTQPVPPRLVEALIGDLTKSLRNIEGLTFHNKR
jgi:hypothetical protein